MNPSAPPVQHSDPAKFILHVTDFSDGSTSAFEHALRLTLANEGELTVMHVGDDSELDWDSFPSLRESLCRWGMLPQDAQRADVAKLGIRAKKIAVEGTSVADVVADYSDKYSVDLLVVATEQRGRLNDWFGRRSTDVAMMKAGLPVLFVPAKGRGCVAPEDGRVKMRHILIPVDHRPSPDAAIERGLRALAAFGDGESTLTLLHVGSESRFPDVAVPDGNWRVVRSVRDGEPAVAIVAAAEETDADLVIMVTQGTDGVLDVLRGTTTAQVLRHTPCPLLAIPTDF